MKRHGFRGQVTYLFIPWLNDKARRNAKSSELKLRTFSTLPMSLPQQLRYFQPAHNIIGGFSYSRLEKRQPEHLLYKKDHPCSMGKACGHGFRGKVWVCCCCCGYCFNSNPTLCLPRRMKRPTQNRMVQRKQGITKGVNSKQKHFYWSFSFSSTWWKWYLGSQELPWVQVRQRSRGWQHRA